MQAYSYYFSHDNVGLLGVALYFKVLTQVELAEGWAGIEVGCPLAVHCNMLSAICPPVAIKPVLNSCCAKLNSPAKQHYPTTFGRPVHPCQARRGRLA